MPLCPKGCFNCCDTYSVAVTNGDHDGKTYSLTRTGVVWTDDTTYPGFEAVLQCNSSLSRWELTLTTSGCTEVWIIAADTAECPPGGGDYTLDSSDCSPAAFVTVDGSDCPSPSGPTIGGNLLLAGY